MKKVTLLLAFVFGAFSIASAQNTAKPKIEFENTHHDFGKIKEDDGPVSYNYKFKNVGKAYLQVTKVQPACGCTVADYTKDSVAPGGEGYVKATYDVRHRPGGFSKSVTVYTNGDPQVSLLTFSGEVLPHVKTVEDSFPSVIGNLRFESNSVNFSKLANNVKDTIQYLSMYNSGNTPITIKEFNSTRPYISADKLPITIGPKQKAKLAVHYNATMNEDFGLIFDRVKLVTTDAEKGEKEVSVFADIHPYIPPMTDAEKAKAAKIYFPETTHDFGTIKEGDVVNTEFVVKNEGKSKLYIYQVKTTCGCTASEPEKKELKPGESSKIRVSFNSAGKHGAETKYVTIYNNDPTNPEASLKISANVTNSEQ